MRLAAVELTLGATLAPRVGRGREVAAWSASDARQALPGTSSASPDEGHADGRQRDGRREGHVAGAGEDGGERCGPVEPGFGEDEMVIGGEVAEAEVARGGGVLLEAR